MTDFNSTPDVGDPGEPEELYQLLTEHATDLLSLNDPDGRPIWASRSLERLRGRVSTLFENIHPDDLQVVRRWWKQIHAGSAERLRWRMRAAAGEWRWLETSAALLAYRDRAYVLCSARDVTVEKQAQDAQQESARKLTAAARLAHIAYWEDDVLADRVSWSEEAAHVLGVPLTERTGTWREFMQHVHLDDRQYVEERRGRLLRDDEVGYRATFRLLLPDGGMRHVETIAEAVRDEDGRTFRTVGAIQDVSERRHVYEVLRLDQDRFQLALQATGLGFWDWDRHTDIVQFLPAGKRLLGLDPNEMPQRFEAWVDRLHPDDRERVLAAARACLEGRQPEFALEFRLRHEDGTDRWIYTSGVIVRDATGRPTHLIGCHLNITERKQLEEQFRQAQKMEAVGRLSAGIAHDFNNLLTVISGYAELVAEALGPSHRSRADLGEIQAAAASAAGLTRQLLAFSRRQVLQPQILDLNDVLRRVELLLRRVIGEDITLTLNLSALGRVNADPGQMEQVIMNLAVNARDAMPNGGQLTIETADVTLDDVFVAQHRGATAGRHVLVAISDTGRGMDDVTRVHLFEPFFTTKPSDKGTGLGLATVYGIVKQSRGSIWVYSELGKGTTFKIYLPIAAGAAEPSPPPVDVQALRGTETVLVVEDQVDVRGVIEKTLSRYGYTLIAAANGPEAIATAQEYQGPIDVMLTDVVLPGASGREIAKQVIASHPSVRVLYMSGYTDDVIVQHGVLEPGLAFVQKPFTGDGLARRIREVLAADSPPLP
jgi:PAS domain S-box-containing protein